MTRRQRADLLHAMHDYVHKAQQLARNLSPQLAELMDYTRCQISEEYLQDEDENSWFDWWDEQDRQRQQTHLN